VVWRPCLFSTEKVFSCLENVGILSSYEVQVSLICSIPKGPHYENVVGMWLLRTYSLKLRFEANKDSFGSVCLIPTGSTWEKAM